MEKIVLDQESFKALSLDTRVSVLKLLIERPHTLTELSETLSMSHGTLSEHLVLLEGAGLVKKNDEGRKWKYYTLTAKGRSIFAPQEVRVYFSFITTLIAAGITGLAFFLRQGTAQNATDAPAEPVMLMAERAMDAPAITTTTIPDPLLAIFIALTIVSTGLLITYLLMRYRGVPRAR